MLRIVDGKSKKGLNFIELNLLREENVCFETLSEGSVIVTYLRGGECILLYIVLLRKSIVCGCYNCGPATDDNSLPSDQT